MKQKTRQIGLFVDECNLFYGVRQAFGKVRINYEALIKFASQRGTVRVANLYTAHNCNDSFQNKFFSRLRSKGFQVITRALKTLPDGSKKGDTDALMGMDIGCEEKNLDEIILVTGDSDFAGVVERLVSAGKTVTVIGPNMSTSTELRQSCHYFYYADEVEGLLQWDGHTAPSPAVVALA